MDRRSILIIQFWMVVFIVTTVMSLSYIVYTHTNGPVFSKVGPDQQNNSEILLEKAKFQNDSLLNIIRQSQTGNFEVWKSDSNSVVIANKTGGPFKSFEEATGWLKSNPDPKAFVIRLYP